MLSKAARDKRLKFFVVGSVCLFIQTLGLNFCKVTIFIANKKTFYRFFEL
jgi:hypothetical protein